MNNLINFTKAKSDSFTNYLLSKSEEVKISRTDSRIASTIRWLLTNQNKNGSWGKDNVASTSLVIMSFVNLLKPSSGWELESSLKKSIDSASNFLIKKYDENHYEHAMWDTSIVVRALLLSGSEKKQFIADRINWLLNINFNTLNAGPHHWAQRTLALHDYGTQKVLIKESIQQISILLERGDYKYSPYVLAQCLEAILNLDIEYDYSQIRDILLNFIKNTNLDSANFINICACLNTLYPILNSEIEKSLRLSISSLFGETCFRKNGTWYHDELSTAWALIALTRFSKEVVIRVPKSEVIYESKRLFEDLVEKTSITIRYNLKHSLIHLANLAIAFALISFFVTYTTLKTDMYEWIKWGIPSIFIAQSTFSFQYYFRKIREVNNDFRN